MSKFWETDIQFLKKVGPQKAQALKKIANLHTYEDLLFYFPRRYVDRSKLMLIKQLNPLDQQAITLIGRFSDFKIVQSASQKSRLTALFSDDTGYVQVTWFQGIEWILKRYSKSKEAFMLYGKPEWIQGVAHFAHPDIEQLDENQDFTRILPVYPGSEGLKKYGIDNRFFVRVIDYLLEVAENEWEEVLPQELLERLPIIERRQAFYYVHQPQSPLEPEQGMNRFKYEEMIAFQWILEAKRKQYKGHSAPAFHKVGQYFMEFYRHHLPFELTDAQKRVIREIRRDCARAYQMNRLVQGDVGSGKTIVAFFAALLAIDNGYQCALMAPTEVLATQHYHTLQQWAQPLNLKVALLTGSTKEKEKKQIVQDLAKNEIQMVIGTHALIEDYVQFANLGLTMIDEQHKFGVEQRAKLWKKQQKEYPHHLVMTATPIPRTLALTLYGDLDLSIIDQLPRGRKPVRTKIVTEAQRLRLYGFIKQQLLKGRQAYFVYPLIEESMKSDLMALTQGYEAIQRSFPNFRVGVVHGKMKPEDKEVEMFRFKQGITQILVSTTVIEVGVDVPNATVMVIENAERFGLSQLHQLRGRVGRGQHASFCFLIPSKINPTIQKRLQAMESFSDGFKISEIDLALRGPGDFLGTRQSGLPAFDTINLVTDGSIIEQVRQAIRESIEVILSKDYPAFFRFLDKFRRKWQMDQLNA